MSYKVIHYFTDMHDSGYEYKVGDNYPRLGKTVTEARIKELAGSNNRQKKPLIAYVEDKPKKAEVVKEVKEDVYTKTDINRMSTDDLRTLASAQGIDDVKEYTGAELKKLLIEKLGL